MLTGIVLGGAEWTHRVLAATPEERKQGLWLLAEKDPDAPVDSTDFVDPAVDLIDRHTGGMLLEADTVDVIRLAIAGAIYLVRNGVTTWRIRRAYQTAGVSDGADETEEE